MTETDARADSDASAGLEPTGRDRVGASGASSDAQPSAAAWVLIGGVQAYRYLLKPWLGNACRFEPTCSAYALDALRRHGALAGGALAAGRLLRCHPWCDGGCDPVPEAPPRLFSRLISPKTPT